MGHLGFDTTVLDRMRIYGLFSENNVTLQDAVYYYCPSIIEKNFVIDAP
jgi:hypothetical protein